MTLALSGPWVGPVQCIMRHLPFLLPLLFVVFGAGRAVFASPLSLGSAARGLQEISVTVMVSGQGLWEEACELTTDGLVLMRSAC